jgi:hypothetical protein
VINSQSRGFGINFQFSIFKMATLTLSFTEASPVPGDGYVVKYREAGGGAYTQVTPNPSASPVVIPGLDDTKAYEGFIQSMCDAGFLSDPVSFSVGAIAVLENFDFMVLRYKNNSGGSDLDTFTGFADNGLAADIDYGASTNWVGFSKPPTTSYLSWGGDNTSGGGVEAVLINFQQLVTDFPSAPDTIRLRLHAWWYASRTTGAAQLELQTWLGGTVPSPSGFDFVKSDGVTVDNILLDTNVTCVRAGVAPHVNCAQRLGEIIYNKVDKTAILVPISGGCGCVSCYNYTLTNSSNPEETVEYTACDGSPATINVSTGATENICAQDGSVYSPNGWVEATQGGTC